MCSNVAALSELAVLVTYSAAALSYSLRQQSLRVGVKLLLLVPSSIQNFYRFSFLNGFYIMIIQLQIAVFFPINLQIMEVLDLLLVTYPNLMKAV